MDDNAIQDGKTSMLELKVLEIPTQKEPDRDQSSTIVYKPKITHRLRLDNEKLAWHSDRVQQYERWKKTKDPRDRFAPITIDMALTRACDYRCEFCYAMLQDNELASYDQDIKRLTSDRINRFLDEAAEVGVKGISFVSDGESTLHPYYYEAILRGKKNGIDMASGTNGYRLKDERLEEILPALTYIRFNFDAGEPRRYVEIMGAPDEAAFHKVVGTIAKCVEIKKRDKLPVTIGLQMVFKPQYRDQLEPLTRLGKELGADYLVIKHCSDDEVGSLGVNYRLYEELIPELEAVEAQTTEDYEVSPKWSKLLSEGKRNYQRCYGPPLILQMSGSGLVAPCGMLFHDRYNENFHVGNIGVDSFKEMILGNTELSDRYWNVMERLGSHEFNAQRMCGALCLQHKVNERMNLYFEQGVEIPREAETPLHVNFI